LKTPLKFAITNIKTRVAKLDRNYVLYDLPSNP